MISKIPSYFFGFVLLSSFLLTAGNMEEKKGVSGSAPNGDIETRIEKLLSQMTLEEKIGQMCQVNGTYGNLTEEIKEAVSEGRIGSILNEVDTKTINELQRIAVEENRLGIPLIFARDVIHGFKTILPIPLGQAATWDPELVEEGAHVAATEAASVGIRWTFAPMVDISRDPRWGRIAESLGEDPYLCSELGRAMVRGFQGKDLSEPGAIAACAKHFVGYGAAEGGRDYNTVNLPEIELRNVYFPPFKACLDAGAATFMTAFNEVNGMPASGNSFLFRKVLRDEWKFDGFVVSDWESVKQLAVHGVAENTEQCAQQAVNAGVDMEMASNTYANHIKELVDKNLVKKETLDEAVRDILRVKFRLGLFDNPYTDPSVFPELVNEKHREVARKAARQSCVLLKNSDQTLPLSIEKINRLAVIGPLADDPYEQLGTWIFDGDPEHTVTPLTAIKEMLYKKARVTFVKVLETSRSLDKKGFSEAVHAAQNADAAILFLGEESILSGEAHCRAEIDLPGAQQALLEAIAATGTPVITVIQAGRPLTLGEVVSHSDALLFAWHPGTMGGPAIADLLFGLESPSGKLPATFPKMVGQIPLYYAHKKTGKPPTESTFVHISAIPVRAAQTSIGNTSFYLDAGYKPLFPFGYGLSYTTFEYKSLKTSSPTLSKGGELSVSVDLSNTGKFGAEEVVQLYIRDPLSTVTRPIRELKGFQRIRLEPGESKNITFYLSVDDLSYFYPQKGWDTEPGKFEVWIGGSSEAELTTGFEVK